MRAEGFRDGNDVDTFRSMPGVNAKSFRRALMKKVSIDTMDRRESVRPILRRIAAAATDRHRGCHRLALVEWGGPETSKPTSKYEKSVVGVAFNIHFIMPVIPR